MPVHYPNRAGQSYRPSNGTEGDIFMESLCDRCMRCDGCDIIMLAMAYDIDDEQYPKEWKFDDDGRPTCTALDAKELESHE